MYVGGGITTLVMFGMLMLYHDNIFIMTLDNKYVRYMFPLAINLALAYPFIYFLIKPENVTGKFITNLNYILLLRVASSFATLLLFSRKSGFKIAQLGWVLIIVLILQKAITQTSPLLIGYFVGGVVTDYLTMQQKGERINVLLNSTYKMLLLFILIFPAGIISELIHKHYYPALSTLSSSIKTFDDAGGIVLIVVLMVMFYVLEPFTSQIIETLFVPKGRLADLLHSSRKKS